MMKKSKATFRLVIVMVNHMQDKSDKNASREVFVIPSDSNFGFGCLFFCIMDSRAMGNGH